MKKIEFSKHEKEQLVKKIQDYFDDELDHDIGAFDAEFLMDFFAKELGAYYYNRGLYDAQAFLQQKMDEFSDSLYELEKPTDFYK
ncbi:DUF2164 domain-containing protein [Vibrio sp.]|nr:DUF2164 domain-containing protein [Vibrio sp.]